MTGQTISHYRILEKLGEGAMGAVYKAEDTKLRRTVALKFLLKQEPELRERFLREAQAAAALHHPNICTLFEIDEENGFLAMEFVEGPTLKEKIAERPLKLEEALDLAIQIAQGLQAAQEKRVVHRDIKPGNILLTPQGQAKITDFGLAALGDKTRLTKSGVSMGTPAYMSPEQATGDPLDRRTDLWSLGAVLYEMLTGRVPFSGESEQAITYGVVHVDPEPLTALRSGLPIGVDRVMAKLLAKNPGERYQNAADLIVDLQANSRARVTPRGRTRRRMAAWVAIAAAISAALAGGLWFLRFTQQWRNPLEGARYSRVTDFDGMEIEAAISPDGKLVAFLSDRDGQYDIWVTHVGTQDFLNLSRGNSPDLSNFDTVGLGFTPDASQIWFHQWTRGRLPVFTSLMPAFGGTPRRILDAVSVAWSPDGRRIVYHPAEAGDPIYISDPDGMNRKEIFRAQAGGHCHFPVWSPDGSFIYFVMGYPPDQMDVWRIPSVGGRPERITHHNSRVRYPALLDEKNLLYIATADDGSGSRLYVMDLLDRVPRPASTGLEQYTSVSLDHPGPGRPRRLVATMLSPTAGLFAVPITGGIADESAVERVATPNTQAQGPRVWKDQILYLAGSGPAHALWRRESASRASELWKATGGGLAAPPAVSPDGRLIAFSFRRNNRAGLYLMNSDGSNLRTLSDSFDVRSAPSWSPDGKWLVVSGEQGQGSRVFKVAVDGGSTGKLLDIQASHPVWSPDGTMIVHTEADVGGSHKLRAMTPEGKPLPFPDLTIERRTDVYRFLPAGKGMVFLQGHAPRQQFWLLDLASGNSRKLTELQHGFNTQSFDVTPDGKRIIFDRIRGNADVVLIELAKK